MIKNSLVLLVFLGFASSANASLFSEETHDEICADDLGIGVQLNRDGSEVQTGECENTDPDMDYSQLQIGDDREFIRESQGSTR